MHQAAYAVKAIWINQAIDQQLLTGNYTYSCFCVIRPCQSGTTGSDKECNVKRFLKPKNYHCQATVEIYIDSIYR